MRYLHLFHLSFRTVGLLGAGSLLGGCQVQSEKEHFIEGPRLELSGPLPQIFTYAATQDGTLWAANCLDVRGREHGMILIWEPEDGGKLVDLGNLSSLDEVLRAQVMRLGRDPAPREVMGIVAPALGEYSRLTTKGFLVLFDSEIEDFIAGMRPFVSAAEFERISMRLTNSAPVVINESWMLRYVVYTRDYAIEVRSFYGTIEPFSLTKSETEIVAPAGLLNGYDYVRKLDASGPQPRS